MQQPIPFMQFRGGSSKGLYFNAADLPTDEAARNRMVLAAMEGVGIGDPRQIDGLGGGTSLTSKVAIVSRSATPDADLDYLFLQVVVGKGIVTTAQNCGNILAGVLPFAIESGLFPASDTTTAATIKMVNTGGYCEVIVQTPDRAVQYQGTATIDGVAGSAAAILCNYMDTVGSSCGSLLPTGNPIDEVLGTEVTCIDNGMPVVLMRASDVGISGYETKAVLDQHESLKKQIESIRIAAGVLMGLGDVTHQTIPKICLLAAPIAGGTVHTRMFIPHVVHDAIGVLAAVSVATACVVPGSVAAGLAIMNAQQVYSIEHPSGSCAVQLDYHMANGLLEIKKSGVIRTARLLCKGTLYIPENIG